MTQQDESCLSPYLNGTLTTEDLIKLTDPQRGLIDGPTLFALKYRRLPCTLSPNRISSSSGYNDIFTLNLAGHFSSLNRGRQWNTQQKQGGMFHATSALDFLVNEYNVNREGFLYEWSYNEHEKNSIMSKIYIDLEDYLSVQFYGGSLSPTNVDNPNNLQSDNEENNFKCFSTCQIFHIPERSEPAQTLLEQLSKFKLYPITEATLQMVCHSSELSFYTSSIRMKKPHISDLKLHYGDDFIHIHQELLETLQQKDSTGISFFHGPPGTGKTFYLRYLINEIKDKSLIYVPPDLVKEVTKPSFLPFLMKHPNSILIIEDAEHIIRDRKQDDIFSNQAVSNLLNLSDGLLGDAMHQQIICTFNCDVKGLDPALLRDGRLVVEHYFDKLSVENARRLCVELNIPGHGQDIHQATSLAEIYAKKNSASQDLSKDLENGQTIGKNKRSIKDKQKEHSFLGFYS